MKIGIIGPSPVPFTVGGVENLLWGLCNTINQETEHQCELIKIPSREYSFWDLIQNYYNFYTLDVSHFDAVICTKYPAWMVQHPNCIFYVQHCLRGLYDTYHFCHMPTTVERGNCYIDKILDYMEQYPHPQSLDEYFAMLFELRDYADLIPEHYFQFPGPFIRLILKYMDCFGLSQSPKKQYYCISNTVKKRTEYFPEGAQVKAVHHPSFLKNYSCGEYKHIFMVSRLDGPKRIDMLIKAMRYVKGDVKLYIAGTGPKEQELKEMAAGDDRIEFLGFVNDEEVEKYYADSLVIPYFPHDEDFGLITIEAMMHKKPVITTVDAGGPTEFVFNGETGFVTELDEKAIAEKINYFVEYPEEAKRQGENAYQIVKDITWKNIVDQLLSKEWMAEGEKDTVSVIEEKVKQTHDKSRKKIVVTSTFSIFPAMGGGQARTFNIYKKLAHDYDVEIVSVDAVDKKASRTMIAPHLVENKIPKTAEHQREESRIESRVNIPLTDIAMITLSGLTPEYGVALKKAIEECDMVILSHPYLYPEVKKYLNGKKFAYEAQDVEYLIKKGMLPQNSCSEELLAQVYEVEKECCEKSEFIMTCSEDDASSLQKLYGVSAEKIIIVPNGVDSAATKFVPVSDRLVMKKKLGLEHEKSGLFMGSWHQPNLDACEEIFKIAEKCPDVKFFLMGSQCLYFRGRVIPDNVGMLGLVSEEEKNRVFSVVDFALNPMRSGSGTNLKMFDYMSAGIPILTTAFGTRGIDDKSQFIICEVDEMPTVVSDFKLEDYADRIDSARKYVEETFDWSVIVQVLKERLEKLDI